MAGTVYGYREGVRRLIPVLIDASTTAISVGDMLTLGTAGFYQKIAAGEIPHGVAFEACSVPAADGDISILMDISEDSVYEYPPDAGTVTQALVGKTCDVGGAQSIDIDATADDVILIRRVNLTTNTLYIQLRPTFAGV